MGERCQLQLLQQRLRQGFRASRAYPSPVHFSPRASKRTLTLVRGPPPTVLRLALIVQPPSTAQAVRCSSH